MTAMVENMAYVGEVPWHGIGFAIDPDATIEEWRIAAGLNWAVKSALVRYAAHTECEGVKNRDWSSVPNRQVLYRDDTGQALGIVSANRYKIVQPAQILEFYEDLVRDSGFRMETAGSLDDGKRIWALARGENEMRIMGQDKILPYLLLATSYDGTLATLASFTTVRVVCNNTLQMAVSETMHNEAGQVKVSHASEFSANDVKEQLGMVDGSIRDFETLANRLALAKITDKDAMTYFVDLFGNKDKAGNLNVTKQLETAVQHMFTLYKKGPGSEYRSAQGTGWGLVNAVTGYIDHIPTARSDNSRLKSAWFGQGRALKAKAVEKVLNDFAEAA